MTIHTNDSGVSENEQASINIHAAADGASSNAVDLGRQLREAREARGLDIETCGHTLRLPVRVLRQLEAGDYSGIDHAVYLRNYLTSYAACIGLSKDTIQEALRQLAPVERKPELISTGGVSRSQYLWQRYTTAATYIVLTAVIVVPLVWLGIKGGLDRELTHLEPLNSAPVAKQDVAHADTQSDQTGKPVAPQYNATRTNADEQPLMASMAPFSALDSVGKLPEPVTAPAVAVPGSHTLSLALTKPSWVEITTADGDHLAYSLFPAGTKKTWHSTQSFHVSIGDSTGASVLLDGKPVALDDYKHANVAHFRIALKDGRASVQAM